MADGSGYLGLMRARYAPRLLAGTLVGRLPAAMAALAIMLYARAEGADYTLASVLSATYGITMAVGQPLLGRAVDKRGQTRVMTGAVLLSAAGFTLFALVGPEPLLLSVPAVAVAGLCTPPLEAGLRALWPSVLGNQGQVHAAYALDAAAQEIMFAGGPLLVTLVVATASEGAAVVATGLLGVAGTAVVVTSKPSRQWRGEPQEAHWLGPLRSVGLRALFSSLFFVGVALGAISVAAVAYGERHGGEGVTGWLLAALGFGALVGGLGYGVRTWPGAPERRLRLLMTGLALGYPPLLLTPGVGPMVGLAVLSGVFLAPALACSFVVVDRHAPAGTVTEAFSWLVTAFGVGASLGTAAAGPAVQHGGADAGYGVAAGGGVVALLVLLATTRVLAAPAQRPQPAPLPTV
ncbi:MFS transporter [Wenjunlia vitaminophila]|uniref:MFS transporter n=1 Tax=Wenjunlia vitaminophila TaxID=76728 RepID=A0A0T6LW82_WENVI|nr:MFS transporter [Wenjunlia vitaminophila]KRV50264.1 MFS transporter [Wenjunlia vitaminophila]